MSAQAALTEKLFAISDLIRLPKQYGTLLLLCPTLWSLFIATEGRPSLKLLGIFILGTFLMRSAGCAINDIADRNFDRFVERTKARPLASGRLTLKEAIVTFLALSFLAFILVLFLNPLTIILSVIGISLASIYPFIKRVSHLPQVFLGIAFGWGAKMGNVYFAILLLSGILFEYMVFILKYSPTRETAFRIFLVNAGVGLFILAGIFADYAV